MARPTVPLDEYVTDPPAALARARATPGLMEMSAGAQINGKIVYRSEPARQLPKPDSAHIERVDVADFAEAKSLKSGTAA